VYAVDILIPTARIAFAVEGGEVAFMAEHRPPDAYRAYGEFKRRHPVVGMTTFPNTVLLRGPLTVLVDPGLHLQNEPVLRALEARGLSPADVDLVALTHAHLDHAGACIDVGLPVVVHEAETQEPHWAAVRGVMELLPVSFLSGDEGELVDGIGWTRTPGHSEGSISLRVPTKSGLVVLCGDTVGPLPEEFAALAAPADEPQADRILASWRAIRSWQPALIVPGHLRPLAPADWQS
jgi:glyoxylase-like metal-dependent hydrolase (beta-lactamase superfamily II)